MHHIRYREYLESPCSRPWWCHDPERRSHTTTRIIPIPALPQLEPGRNIGESSESGKALRNREQFQHHCRQGAGPGQGGDSEVHLHRVWEELCPLQVPGEAPAGPWQNRAPRLRRVRPLLPGQSGPALPPPLPLPHHPSAPGLPGLGLGRQHQKPLLRAEVLVCSSVWG